MASTGKKWAIGCGIGCGFFLLMGGILGTCGYYSVRQIVDRAEVIEESFDELDAQFGDPGDFVPDPEGRVAADRMETFLSVRQQMAPSREKSSLLMAQLSDDDDSSGPSKVFGKIKAGVGFVPAMMNFIEERNQILLNHDMGLGEYQYIYVLAYFVHLEKDPADGPDFPISGPDEDDHEAGPVRWNVQRSNNDSDDVRVDREREVRRFLNDSMVLLARNQLEALDALLADKDDPELQNFRVKLAEEIEDMEREPRRIFWEEGLPASLSDSFEVFRTRLDESYDEQMNAVEMGLVTHQ